MFGLLGQNGAGKSTLMRTIATLQNADQGSISFNGIDAFEQPHELRKVLGYLPQKFGVYPSVTAEELLLHVADMKGIAHKTERKEQVATLLEKVNLYPVRKKKLDSCSGGMKQRFGIAQALSSLINMLIALGYVIGMLLVPYSGIGEAHRFGSAPIGQLLHGFFTPLVPNLLLLTSLVFFALVYFKKMAAGYLAVLVTVVAFLIMQTVSETSGVTPLLLLADPFGYVATGYSIDFMSMADKNYGYLKLSDYLLYNRLLWLGASLLLFVLAYLKFNFKGFLKQDTQTRICGGAD